MRHKHTFILPDVRLHRRRLLRYARQTHIHEPEHHVMRRIGSVVWRHMRCIDERCKRQIPCRLPRAHKCMVDCPWLRLGALHALSAMPGQMINKSLQAQGRAHQILITGVQEHRHTTLKDSWKVRSTRSGIPRVCVDCRAHIWIAFDPRLRPHRCIYMQRRQHVVPAQVLGHSANFRWPIHATGWRLVGKADVVYIDAMFCPTDSACVYICVSTSLLFFVFFFFSHMPARRTYL